MSLCVNAMHRVTRARRWRCATVLSIWAACTLLASPLQAQRVGTTIGVEGTAEVKRQSLNFQPLALRAPVRQLDTLKTLQSSKLDVLLRSAHKFMLGESVQVTLETAGDNSALVLESGIIRILTSGRPGSSVVIRNNLSRGQATATGTSFIVDCVPGPPASCLFVGLYNQTRVVSLDYPDPAPVVLGRQQFTRVVAGEPPSPNPPELLDDRGFQALIAATTLIGTGSRTDQVAATDPAANRWPGPNPLLDLLSTRPLTDLEFDFGVDYFQLVVPDQPPLEFDPLPQPPVLPGPPR